MSGAIHSLREATRLMSKPRKYLVGERVTDPIEAVRLILAGEYLFIHERAVHPSFLRSVRLDTIANMAGRSLFRAVINPEWRPINPSNSED